MTSRSTTDFSIVVDIKASPDRVLPVLYDVERWPEWTSTMTSVRRMDAGPFAVGSRARVRQPKLLPAVWQVTELDERRSFTWVTRSPGVQIRAGHLVEVDGAGSRVTLSLEFSGLLGPLVARLYRSLNERYLATEAEGLRKRCEG
jgi:uncharacterized protein YndB with AHSA1/START domain